MMKKMLAVLLFCFVTLLIFVIENFSSTAAKVDSTGWGRDLRLTNDPDDSRLNYNFAWSIATDEFGDVHIIWYSQREGKSRIYYRGSMDGGVRWGDQQALSESNAPALNPAIAASGLSVYAVWPQATEGKLDLYFRRSADRGSSWEPAIRLTQTGKSGPPSIAVSGNHIQVVWIDNRHEHAEIYTCRSTDQGRTWDPPQLLSEVPHHSWVPTVTISGKSVYVAWVDYRDANEEEYFCSSLDQGATWQPIQRLTDNFADSWAPSIAASGKTVHLTWFDRRNAGVSDSEVENKLDDAFELLGLPVEPAPPRNPSIYYLDLFHSGVKSKLARIQTFAPGWVQKGGDFRALEAILKEFERRMKRWANGWEIYYKRSLDGGFTWTSDVRLTKAPGNSARPSIVVSGEQVQIVWFDFRDDNSEIYYKASFDGGYTWTPDIRLTNAAGDSQHPSIALSLQKVHVVWFDNRAGNNEIYYKNCMR